MSLPQFELFPSTGLSEIKLGTNLHTILQQLSPLHLQVAYSPSSDLIRDPITVTIKKYAIRLTFDPDRQLLMFIELLDLDKIGLSYKGKFIRDKSFKTLYDHYIGPTYPGEVANGSYILSYPGLSFRFDVPDDVDTRKIDGDDKTLDAFLEKNPRAMSVVVHGFTKWPEYGEMKPYLELVKRVSLYPVELEKLSIDNARGTIDLRFFKHPTLKSLQLTLNQSKQQDVLLALGPPDEVFSKNDSRTLIHNSDADHSVITTASVFHNYFKFGFDLLYNTKRTGAVLSKIVIHNNIPTNVMFGKYAKCQWEMIDRSGSQNSEMSFSDMNLITSGKTPAVVLNRNEMLSNSIELWEDVPGEGDANETKWGKSVVYALEGQIWDVVDDCVNSLTLY